MARRLRLLIILSSWCFVTQCGLRQAAAQTIWSGLTKSFSKAAGTDATLPENQDVLASTVKLTRGNSGGMINIAAESYFDPAASPTLTLWATDLNNVGKTIAATNYSNLAFTNWINAFGGQHSGGGSIQDRNAVVKIASLNLYLDLKFTGWEPGLGGGYAYLRAEPPAPVPSGDYNGNGRVDAADYVLWRRTLGQTGVTNGSGADGNSNGEIDDGDYTYWRARFDTLVNGASLDDAAAVPEPAAVLCVVYGCGLLIAMRFGRRR